ncbi:hypothetical protein BAUCODRAFT_481165 [Baudoinia panamericana UAMH 10762]|uniref:Uncharacterized protein n=1 Tax=Baudoinia panamericana (strain UAMH 10762) TaxID=717646 RepID=M2NBQ4_BAUPA|nr:uncharacterized protein BAUCODRAFT_481165 [Baudoinia panamericana UAMH 10762]EMC96574.1 hypothetical protein BAUCODRAFT_481165 [Baudoinia panamericana UAMH 10762]
MALGPQGHPKQHAATPNHACSNHQPVSNYILSNRLRIIVDPQRRNLPAEAGQVRYSNAWSCAAVGTGETGVSMVNNLFTALHNGDNKSAERLLKRATADHLNRRDRPATCDCPHAPEACVPQQYRELQRPGRGRCWQAISCSRHAEHGSSIASSPDIAAHAPHTKSATARSPRRRLYKCWWNMRSSVPDSAVLAEGLAQHP